MTNPKITFIGAGSSVFMKNIVGDVLQRPALAGAEIRLMDINLQRLEESEIIATKLVNTLGVPATVKTYSNQREALDGTNFVVVCFQIGGYEPSTVVDFEVPKKYKLRQTIGDTLGVGGIMRGLRTVPHLWSICEDMLEVAPEAVMLQYVNPMAINTWAIAEKYPTIKQVGLLPLGAGHRDGTRARSRHPVLRDPLPLGRHQPYGVLSQVRASPGRWQLSRSLPGPGPRLPRRPRSQSPPGIRAAPTRCATRC